MRQVKPAQRVMMSTMSSVNAYVERELQRINGNIKQRNVDESLKRKHRRNVEELLKFTSNLISFLGNTGVTFQRGNNNHRKGKKFNSPITDYKGSIAGNMFGARFPSNAMRNKRGVKTLK